MIGKIDGHVKRDLAAECRAIWTTQQYVQHVHGAPDKVQGRAAWWCSPFRSEKTASFKVDLETGQWFDHGAENEGGDLIRFAEKYHRVDFKGACEILLGMSLEAAKQKPVVAPASVRVMPSAPPLSMEMVRNWHEVYMNSGSTFWQDRGFSQQTIIEQMLGVEVCDRNYRLSDDTWVKFPRRRYTIPYWSGTTPKSLQRRRDDALIGSFLRSPKGKEQAEMVLFDLKAQRIKENKSPDVSAEDVINAIYGPKYYRYADGSSEHFPYYNINLLWKRTPEGQIIIDPSRNVPELEWWDTIIIVEGELKALALVECGYPAIFMKHHAASKVDIPWLFSRVERIAILRDGDDAGVNLAEKLAEKVGSKACVMKPESGYKGADDMIADRVIDDWARKNAILPYFIPRSNKGGAWSAAPLFPRTI